MAKTPTQSNKGEAAAPLPTSPKPPRQFSRLLSRKQVLALLPEGVTYATLWSWVQKKLFPAPVELGDGQRLGWKDNEVYDALDNLPRRFPKGTKGAGDED